MRSPQAKLRRNAARKLRYHTDPEYRLNESNRKKQYYVENQAIVDTKNKEWAKNNREEHKIISRESAKKRRHELREEFIITNGSKCVCCGETNQEFFTLDHIESFKGHRSGAYREAKKDGWSPEKYQLLCMGCNLAKGIYGACPHQKPPDDKSYHFKIKLQVIEEYGGSCKCCNENDPYFLVIDHVNGGGVAHRKEVKSIIMWLYNNKFPKDGFRLLCANCNHSLGAYGSCPHAK